MTSEYRISVSSCGNGYAGPFTACVRETTDEKARALSPIVASTQDGALSAMVAALKAAGCRGQVRVSYGVELEKPVWLSRREAVS